MPEPLFCLSLCAERLSPLKQSLTDWKTKVRIVNWVEKQPGFLCLSSQESWFLLSQDSGVSNSEIIILSRRSLTPLERSE